MGKCLFFDADGTILDIVKGTPEDTKLALQQLRKRTQDFHLYRSFKRFCSGISYEGDWI